MNVLIILVIAALTIIFLGRQDYVQVPLRSLESLPCREGVQRLATENADMSSAFLIPSFNTSTLSFSEHLVHVLGYLDPEAWRMLHWTVKKVPSSLLDVRVLFPLFQASRLNTSEYERPLFAATGRGSDCAVQLTGGKSICRSLGTGCDGLTGSNSGAWQIDVSFSLSLSTLPMC